MRRAGKQWSVSIVVQRENMLGSAFERDLRHPAKIERRAYDHGWFGIGNEILDFRCTVCRIERQVHIAGANGRQIQHQCLRRLVDLNRDARILRQSQAGKQVGNLCCRAVQIVPWIVQTIVSLDAACAAVFRKAWFEKSVEIGVHTMQWSIGNCGFHGSYVPTKNGSRLSRKACTPSR